jgi:hypothetical protein
VIPQEGKKKFFQQKGNKKKKPWHTVGHRRLFFSSSFGWFKKGRRREGLVSSSCPQYIVPAPLCFCQKKKVGLISPTYSPNVIKIQEERKNIYIVLQGRNLKIFTTHLYGALQLIPGHLLGWVGLYIF